MVLQFSGRLTAVTDGEKTLAEYVYSASGNPVVKKIGGNVTSTYAYDELLNIKALKTEAGKQALADNHYFYDGNGNQIRREGLEGTTGYAYDGRNRLTEISYPSALGGYTEKLGYDAAGNRIRRETEQEITTYHYDNCNRLQELHREYKNTETSTAQPQIIRYTYDRQGNMLSEGEKKYSYDSFGRMVRAEVPVESPGTREFQVQINRYDGEGLRHEMEENGRLIKFLYNEDREVVAEETGNGTITRYIRGLGIISSDSEEAKTYYHYVSDEQGSITHVLSEDAEILNHYSYDAFGNIIQKTEKVENRFCYNGEMLDPVTQQYYLRARFYNPVIGRFTQEDTYYGDGLNLYQYCQANPIGYVDPSGHTCEIVQNHYEQYQEYRKQHPRATAAEAYEAVTGKDPLKKGGSGRATDFYVSPNGDIVPATGYRYVSENAPYLDDMTNNMKIPANADGTYFSFNNYNVANPSALQVPHDASVKVSFDTLQIIDDINVPYGKWGKASYLEPITKDFPEFGSGGATQVITHSGIKIKSITKLPKH